MGKCYSRLSFQERLVIQKLYKKGMTMAETEKIARIIGRNRTTIYREVLHNTADGQPYNAMEAVTITAGQKAILHRWKEKQTQLC